jgi:hypothetical protein
MFMAEGGGYLNGNSWRQTTAVMSITPIVHIQTCEECGNDDAAEGQKKCMDCLEAEDQSSWGEYPPISGVFEAFDHLRQERQ